jgi:hypothetical protein
MVKITGRQNRRDKSEDLPFSTNLAKIPGPVSFEGQK